MADSPASKWPAASAQSIEVIRKKPKKKDSKGSIQKEGSGKVERKKKSVPIDETTSTAAAISPQPATHVSSPSEQTSNARVESLPANSIPTASEVAEPSPQLVAPIEPVVEQPQAAAPLPPQTEKSPRTAPQPQLAKAMPVEPALIPAEQEQQAIANLSEGFMGSLYQPLEHLAKQLDELKRSQQVMIKALQTENDKIQSVPELQRLVNLFGQLPTYQAKVVQLRKEMDSLTEQWAKLKKRTTKLVEKKQKSELEETLRRQREAEKDRQLMAKPAASLLDSSST